MYCENEVVLLLLEESDWEVVRLLPKFIPNDNEEEEEEEAEGDESLDAAFNTPAP